MTKYLSIAILLTSFLAVNAYGEDEVYYCAGNAATGFIFDEKLGSYKAGKFNPLKFKIKVDLPNKRIEMAIAGVTNDSYICSQPFHRKASLSCFNTFYMFNFNPDNGQYVFAKGYGYVESGSDSVVVTIGKCDKF
jgi:hypothetical protein